AARRSSMPPCRAGSRKPRGRPSPAFTIISSRARRAPKTRTSGPTMKSDRRVPVAIIGGGFSGTILAAQLARRGIASALIDGSGRAGNGVAYSTREPAHLLNVRAEGMSAWSGEPGHFVERFEAEGGDSRGFAERRFFARYLQDILDEAVSSGKAEVVETFATEARRRDGGWSLELEDGGSLEADALVLAIGNQAPEPLGALAAAGDRYIAN